MQFLVGFILATLFFVAPALAQDGEAKVRMIHLSPDAPAVKVTVDGKEIEALSDVSYLDATPYLTLPAGPHKLAVYATADSSEPVLEVEISAEAGRCYTIAGVGLLADETFGARLFEDERRAEEDKAKVRVIHAVPDVGPAQVSVADGPDLFALPGFANASSYVEVDEGTYTLDVTPAGADTPAFSVPDVSVEAGKTYTAFAIGRAADGSVGTIVTDDSTDEGEIVARTGAAAENEDTAESAAGPEPPEARVASASKEPEPEPKSKSEPEAAPQGETAAAGEIAAEDPKPVREEESASHSQEVAIAEAPQPVSQEVAYEEPVYYEPAPPQPVYYKEVVHYTDVPQTNIPQPSIPQTNVPQAVDPVIATGVATGSGSVSTSSQTVENYSTVSSGDSSADVPVATGAIGSTVGGAVVNGQNAVLNSGARRRFVLATGKSRRYGKTEDG
ncbi:DUF4397 domain-containing protein [Rubrobacter indicoceani]|uniref:DUF4397 domain-containing protein n=1 Tax=Rubrobacter indicoceani TaxID=2051957 RepID=UPI0013C4F7F3|nr:DUF4397 domain-containing protein [Rubrobacter indicoceani]